MTNCTFIHTKQIPAASYYYCCGLNMKNRGLLYVLFFCSEVLISVWIKMVCVFEYNVCVWVNCLCLNKMFWKIYVYFDFTIQGSTEFRPPRIVPPFLLSIPLISISSSFYHVFFHIHTHSILKVTLTPLHLWRWKVQSCYPFLGSLHRRLFHNFFPYN